MKDIDHIQNTLAFIDSEIVNLVGPGDYRTRVFCALSDVAMEHGKSIYTLIRQELYSSAYALVRAMFESGVRSLWVSRCATEKELEVYIEKDTIKKLNMREMTAIVDETYKMNGRLIKVHGDVWSEMNSFTHGGILQVRKRLNDGVVTPDWSEQSESHLCQLIALMLLVLYTEVLVVTKPLDQEQQEATLNELLRCVFPAAKES